MLTQYLHKLGMNILHTASPRLIHLFPGLLVRKRHVEALEYGEKIGDNLFSCEFEEPRFTLFFALTIIHEVGFCPLPPVEISRFLPRTLAELFLQALDPVLRRHFAI